MYPNFRYLIYDLLGLDIPALEVLQVYGFFLAMAFFAAGYWLTVELKRREKLGLLTGMKETTTIKPATPIDYLLNFLIGFLIGFKLIYYVRNSANISAGGDFLFSMTGDWLMGLLIGTAFVVFKYTEARKITTSSTVERLVMPHERVSDIVILAAVSGIIGAKLLFHLEAWDDFLRDPINQFFSLSGLTVYGGLIVGFFVVSYYLKKKQISYGQMLDVCAPALALAAGIGRLACHFSGDGCWGKANPSAAPAFMPDWLWACNYQNNVTNAVGDKDFKIIQDCNGLLPLSPTGKPEDGYCTELLTPVFPTSLYEFILLAVVLFGLLFILRKPLQHKPMALFGIYLIFNGIERFFIEFIRVNTPYKLLGMNFSMSQYIALVILAIGVALSAWVWSRKEEQEIKASEEH